MQGWLVNVKKQLDTKSPLDVWVCVVHAYNETADGAQKDVQDLFDLLGPGFTVTDVTPDS